MSGVHFEIKNLSLSRGQKAVLAQVNLVVAPGEIVCLLGPSGSGKSSLLRCLNLLIEPPVNTIFLDKQDIAGLDVVELRQRVGMVFQQAALFPGNVRDNLAYGPSLRQEKLADSDISHLLDLVGLDAKIAHQPADTLSGGQAQRVSLARTLANQPQALLLDEPTSALDPGATRTIEETILNLRQKLGLTVLWVTHNIEEARRVADRIYLLVDGRIADEGKPEHLLEQGSHHLTKLFAAGELDQ